MATDGSKMIALIDDDPAVLDSLRFLLEVSGHRVAVYRSAAEFLAGGDRGAACMIVDQHMPVMSGLELIARLDDAARHKTMLITGSLTPAISERAAALGVALVLEKPPGSSELLDFVNACEAGRQGAVGTHP